MKLLVTGSRTIDDKSWIYKTLYKFYHMKPFNEIIIGDARGVDFWTKEWCKKNGIPFQEFKAEWNKHGKAAGPIRNKEMVVECDGGIGLWDGKSRGTRHCLTELQKVNKLIGVYYYE